MSHLRGLQYITLPPIVYILTIEYALLPYFSQVRQRILTSRAVQQHLSTGRLRRLADCVEQRPALHRTRGAFAAHGLREDEVQSRCGGPPYSMLHISSISSSRALRHLYTCTELYGGTAGAFSNPLGCVCCRVQSKEPERTERLLASPLAVFPPIGSDAFESIAVTVLFKCRGDRKHLGYHLFKLTAQDMP